MALFRGTPIQYEPLKNNRFLIEFPAELSIENFIVKSVTRPSFSINKVPIPYFDQEVFVTGKVTYAPVTFTFINHQAPSTTQKLMEWFRLHHETLTNRSGYAAGYKKTILLKQTDPSGIEVARWTLFDCQIESLDFGTSDYGDDGVQEVTMTVQPDRIETPF